MSIEKSEKLDYSKIQYAHPSYHMHRVLQQAGTQTINITVAGGQESVFEIPVSVFNLPRTELSYTYRIPEVNTKYVYTYKDVQSHIRQIQLYNRSGQYLCDLNNSAEYSKVVFKTDIQLEEFLTYDLQTSAATELASVGASQMLQRNNNSLLTALPNGYVFTDFGTLGGGTVAAAATGILTFSQAITANFAVGDLVQIFATAAAEKVEGFVVRIIDGSNIQLGQALPAFGAGNITSILRYRLQNNVGVTQKRYDNTTSQLIGTEPQYIEVGAVGNGGNAGDLFGKVKIPLGMYKNTVLALDKDLYAGEILLLRIVWNGSNRIYFTGDSPNNPADAPVAGAGDVAISKLQLFVAMEKNMEIVNQLQNQVSTGGMSILIPYVHSYKTNLNGGTQSVSLRFNRGHGIRLHKIYHSLFNSVDTINTAYDNSNVGSTKCSSFYTMLNSSRLQQFDISPAEYEDYMLLKDKLFSSVLQTSNVYQYNWCWIDDFSENINPDEKSIMTKADNYETGLNLSLEQKWDIYITNANVALNHLSFAVCQKLLTVGPSGISVL